ncbi:hypothetical protein BSN82_17210 [Acinetobacter baylyi]|nr:hypothetical protein BSN82_17210 [Acinetobacter baylyi]
MRINISDVPDSYTVLQYIREKTDFLSRCKEVADNHPNYHQTFVRLKVKPTMLAGLKNGVFKAVEKYGLMF